MAFLAATLWMAGCTCAPADIAQKVEHADVIFRGTLSNLSENIEGCTDTGTWNYSIHVSAVYKGRVAERINVQSADPADNPCGIPVDRESEFLFFARKLDNFREYRSDLCMGTRPLADAEQELAYLGDGMPPGNVGCQATGMLQIPWLLWAALAHLAVGQRRRLPRSL